MPSLVKFYYKPLFFTQIASAPTILTKTLICIIIFGFLSGLTFIYVVRNKVSLQIIFYILLYLGFNQIKSVNTSNFSI